MLSVKDTILYVADKSGIRTIAAHIKTKPKTRLTDGKRHPVTIIYPDGKRVVRR